LLLTSFLGLPYLILERFELSASRYYQILNELVDTEAAYEHDPLVVRRLRRLRDRRRRARTETPAAPADGSPT